MKQLIVVALVGLMLAGLDAMKMKGEKSDA